MAMVGHKPTVDLDLIDHASNPISGPLQLGERFAWEPGKPWVRDMVTVTEIAGDRVGLSIPGYPAGVIHWNDESRFREACYRLLQQTDN